MKTYQDFLSIKDKSEADKIAFVKSVIDDHKSSKDYQTAVDAELYDKHQNVTINNFKKLVWNVSGQAIEDIWGTNYRMACRHYHRFTTQEVQFLLGNGITWGNEDTEDKLGTKKYPFDNQFQKAARKARLNKLSFCFWNLDHIDVFGYTEFAPLWDEENGSLRAGVRFWQIDKLKPLRATLYEEDGYTDYMWYNSNMAPSNDWTILNNNVATMAKRPYKIIIQKTKRDDAEIIDGSNYETFPIVPFWGNPEHQSTIIGLREQIDCYDLIKSGFANSVDDASFIYWTLQGAGGMEDSDLQEFVEKIKTLKAVNLPPEVDAQANTINLPYQASEALLNKLDADLYRDAMAFDTDRIANGAVNTTQIKAAYEPLNAKCDEFEYCALDCIYAILELAGIEDEASFTRSMIVNANEDIQTIIAASVNLPSEYVTEKIMTLLGDGDQVSDALKEIEADNYARFDSEE